jgi:hypothetical protein
MMVLYQSISRLVGSILVIIAITSFPAWGQSITVRVQFNNPPSSSTTVVPAVLKYNKDFAFSFALDDGRDDAYTLGFRLLKGGTSEVDKKTYPGLFYTDGCGRRIPFTAGISWYTVNTSGTDLHLGTSSFLTYQQAIEMYQSGWEIYNHSYSHEYNLSSLDLVIRQLQQNHQAFKSKTGVDLRFCVPPSGDTSYIAPAFSLGYQACFTSNSGFSGLSTGPVTQPVPAQKPVYWRSRITSDEEDLESLKIQFDERVATTVTGNQKWWNEFTHRIIYERTGGSLEFETFKAYMEYLESRYGAAGADNGLFASSAEVFDYLVVRDQIVISKKITGTLMEITLNFDKVPDNLRYYDISLMLGTINSINNITIVEGGTVSYARKGNSILVNIDLPDSHFSGVEDNSTFTASDQIKVYPNPSTGIIRFKLAKPVELENIQVFSQDGKEFILPLRSAHSGELELDMTGNEYPSGVYFIRLLSKVNNPGISRFLLIK